MIWCERFTKMTKYQNSQWHEMSESCKLCTFCKSTPYNIFPCVGSKQAIWNGPCPLREPIKTHDLLSLAQGYYQPYSATVSLWLTTTSLHGGWMPETSRSLYYCQPAPIWRLLPWLANPGNPAKSPQARKGKLPGWWGTTSNNTASSHSKHTKDCFKWRAYGIPTHALCKNCWLLRNADALCC